MVFICYRSSLLSRAEALPHHRFPEQVHPPVGDGGFDAKFMLFIFADNASWPKPAIKLVGINFNVEFHVLVNCADIWQRLRHRCRCSSKRGLIGRLKFGMARMSWIRHCFLLIV